MLQVTELRAARGHPIVRRLDTLLSETKPYGNGQRAGSDAGTTVPARRANYAESACGDVHHGRLTDEQRRRMQAMERLFESWMATDPSYDKQTLAELERGLEENPISLRGWSDD